MFVVIISSQDGQAKEISEKAVEKCKRARHVDPSRHEWAKAGKPPGGAARLGGKPASGYEGISRAGRDVGELVRALLDDSDED